MNTVSYTHARQNLKKLCDTACDTLDPIIIQRQKGKNVVIIAQDEYEALNETAYLLSSPYNKKHLQDSLHQMQSGKVVEITIDEL